MAIKRWIGGAVAFADVWTITVAGTWASGDTVTISVGNKDLVITLGGAASTLVADIATEIKNAISAASNASPGTGFTWSHGGQQFREFTEFTATVLGAVVTITGVTAGVPIGLVVTEVTAGDGTATEANTVVATGPNHLDNADNYFGGVLPVDNDDLYIDTGAVSILYGLTYFRANNIDLNVYITGDWIGQLGLPAIRTITGGEYAEYRQRYFQMRGGSKVLQVRPGVQGLTTQGALYIDLQDQSTCDVQILARRGSTTSPSVFLCGSDTTTGHPEMVISAGTVHIEPDDAPSATSKYFLPTNLRIGTPGSALSDCIVIIGKNARLSGGNAMFINGGTVLSYAPTKIGADEIIANVYGGSLELAAVGDEGNIESSLGSVVYLSGSGTVDQIKSRGTLDFRRGTGTKIVTDLKVYAGSSLYNPNGSGTGAHFVGCTLAQLAAHQLPPDRLLNWDTSATP